MADSMIERVARAIAKSRHEDPDEAVRDGVRPGYGQSPLATVPTHPRWRDYTAYAEAAVRAMREPTEKMAKTFEYAKYHAQEDDRRDPFVRAYEAMIDAVLAEDGR